MIVYAVDTAALIREAPVVTLDSYNQAMTRNADGSVDIYFGPQPPAGKEANWIYTAPGKAFFPAMRFYDPDKPTICLRRLSPGLARARSQRLHGSAWQSL